MSETTVIDFHGLARALAERPFDVLRGRWQRSLDRVGSFPFKKLPMEILVAILKIATTKSGTYAALMCSSRAIADIVRFNCVPDVVILDNPTVAISFFACISVHPRVGAGVEQLWYIPALHPRQAAVVSPAIINACHNVKKLACYPDTILDICSNAVFRHTPLVDVLLMDSTIPWARMLASRHGAKLFNQIQALRIAGGTEPAAIPPGVTFNNLMDLTVKSKTVNQCIGSWLLDQVAFPSLERLTVTVPYLAWRDFGMGYLMSAPELNTDARLVIVHCCKKWKELDAWKDGRFALWNSGVTEWNALGRSTAHSRELIE
ncbi:hypothetical protein R3P38DRAFT_1343980 [Favolaschia claudopus]|uniref:F-box domain-containing protein n=1 Tax=Favolaschia claudopus TaxID=2862362 RepID=A0AAW0DUF1_9AGAR